MPHSMLLGRPISNMLGINLRHYSTKSATTADKVPDMSTAKNPFLGAICIDCYIARHVNPESRGKACT